MATAPELPNREKTIILYLCEDYRRDHQLDGSPEGENLINLIQSRMSWANIHGIIRPNQFNEFPTNSEVQVREHLTEHQDRFRTYADKINEEEAKYHDAPDFYLVLPVELNWALFMTKTKLVWVHIQPIAIVGGKVIRVWSSKTAVSPREICRPAAFAVDVSEGSD